MFSYSYRNTSGSLGEQEIEVGTWAHRASVSMQFRILPNFLVQVFLQLYGNMGGMFSISFIK